MKSTTSRPRSRKKRGQALVQSWADHQKPVLLVALVLAIAVPAILDTRYVTTIMINCALYGVLALSLNLITGFMGITSLGHAAFYGIGAYTAAILSTRYNIGFPLTFLAAAAVSALIAFLLGLPTLKATGRHLAIITLGFCEITRIVELNWMDLTRGPMGITGIPTFEIFGLKLTKIYQKYLVAMLLLIITYYIVSAIAGSRTGRAIMSIRDNEIAAEAMGVNVFHYKVLIFSLSAALAGAAGAFYAHYISFIDPKVFTFDQSILILSMVILGGMGSIPGSIIGAILLSAIPELLRGLAEYRQIIYGLVIVLLMVLKPNGLLGEFNLKYMHQNASFRRQKTGGEPHA